jgi:hypothetical protein
LNLSRNLESFAKSIKNLLKLRRKRKKRRRKRRKRKRKRRKRRKNEIKNHVNIQLYNSKKTYLKTKHYP